MPGKDLHTSTVWHRLNKGWDLDTARTTPSMQGNPTHGHARSTGPTCEFRAWQAMLDRCYRAKSTHFSDYGGRGIVVCDRWRESYAAFYADMGPCAKGLTLDRRDNDGNYEPTNCRWATRIEQANNKRNNLRVTIHGDAMTAPEAARKYKVSFWTLRRRALAGLSLEEFVSGVPLPKQPPATHCKRGHQFTPENTLLKRSGKRVCRACVHAAMAEWREKNRAHIREYDREHRRAAR